MATNSDDLKARLAALGAGSGGGGSGGFGRMFRDFGAGALAQVPSWATRTARSVSDLATLGHDNPVSSYLTKTLDDYEDWRFAVNLYNEEDAEVIYPEDGSDPDVLRTLDFDELVAFVSKSRTALDQVK